MSYIAANGQEITEAMIERWCAAYEQGEFPEGEHTVGAAVMGRPLLSIGKTTTMTIKVPVGMKVAMTHKAEEQGKTLSAYARTLLEDGLMAVG